MDLSRLAVKILERVRDFRSNFSDWPEAVAAWAKPKAEGKAAKPARKSDKVYHRQPGKQAAAKTSQKPKRSSSQTKSSRGRKTVKK